MKQLLEEKQKVHKITQNETKEIKEYKTFDVNDTENSDWAV
jgi:hypothetical protein